MPSSEDISLSLDHDKDMMPETVINPEQRRDQEKTPVNVSSPIEAPQHFAMTIDMRKVEAMERVKAVWEAYKLR